MNQAHIVLIDTHGAIIDYRVDADTLASIFTQLQATGERMTFPVIKSEYLKIDTPKPPAPSDMSRVRDCPVSAAPEPEVEDITPLYVGSWWRVYRGLASDYVEVEFDSKPIPYIRHELKENGYRWNRKTERWYGPEVSLPVWLTGAEDTKVPIAVEPDNVLTVDDILTIADQGPRCKPVVHDQPVTKAVEPGKVVRLTGGYSEPSIARGDSWTDCIVEESKDEPVDDDAAFLTKLDSLFKGN